MLSVFGLESGLDTLQFTAQDSLGRVRTTTATVRVFGESEILDLQSIPDIQFIAGQTAVSDTLDSLHAIEESLEIAVDIDDDDIEYRPILVG